MTETTADNKNKEKIIIGKISAPVGLKGEVRIVSLSDDPERFESLDELYVQTKTDIILCRIENIRYKGQQPILKLEGIDDRNGSEAVRGCRLLMNEEDLPELREDQYYVKDIKGFEVCLENGQIIGYLKDVLTHTAQDLYVVKAPCTKKDGSLEKERDILIPGVKEFILKTDTKEKRITVRLPEGLMEI